MLTLKQGVQLSAIIDKLDIKITTLKKAEGQTDADLQKQFGADLIMQVIRSAYKAEQEIYAFIAETKKIDIKDTESIDLIEFIKELISDPAVAGFFNSAVKSEGQG